MVVEGNQLQELIVAAVEYGVFKRHGESYNVLKFAELGAALDSASYYQEHMLACEAVDDDLSLLDRAASRRTVDGLVLEFGVASGRTINHLASLMPHETVYGFDSFDGLPETWRAGYGEGAFAQAPPAVHGNVRLICGRFEATLPRFAREARKPVALLHVDCDLYSSTATVLTALAERIVPGTVIVFDEYFNYPGWRHHEHKAFQEFIAGSGLGYKYVAFVPHHQQVCVVIDK